jgi:DNA-binding response OmpR family regulator
VRSFRSPGSVEGVTSDGHPYSDRRGIVFSRAALLQSVSQDDKYVTERTVDTVISRLRKKIEQDPRAPALILTAWGVGYKFADAD